MATELWRCSWSGNPATKKNSPLPLMFCLCADGKKRQAGAFLERLRGFASLNLADWSAAVEAPEDIEFLRPPASARELLADLEAVTGEGGGRQTIILPEESYRKAVKEVVPQLRREFLKWGDRPPLGGKDQPLAIEAHFYLGPKQRPDLLSLCEAAADLLQAAGVIVNDSWIASWDGSRRHKDQRDRPRTEIVIREFKADAGDGGSLHRGRVTEPAPGLFPEMLG